MDVRSPWPFHLTHSLHNLRLRHPEPIYGLYDAVARLLFFSWQLYYLLAMNGVAIVWMFAVPELGFGLLQAGGYRMVDAGDR